MVGKFNFKILESTPNENEEVKVELRSTKKAKVTTKGKLSVVHSEIGDTELLQIMGDSAESNPFHKEKRDSIISGFEPHTEQSVLQKEVNAITYEQFELNAQECFTEIEKSNFTAEID